jgi:hypothetical protein
MTFQVGDRVKVNPSSTIASHLTLTGNLTLGKEYQIVAAGPGLARKYSLTGEYVELIGDAGQLICVNAVHLEPASTPTPIIHGCTIGDLIQHLSGPIPADFLRCDGSELFRDTYPALFAVLGTRYGGGNGSTTFNIPNMPHLLIHTGPPMVVASGVGARMKKALDYEYSTAPVEPKTCSCPMRELLMYGCQCGGFKAEQARKKN